MTTESNLKRALALHRSGRLAEAEGAYRRILKEAPGDPQALNHLGLLRYQRGDTAQALSLLRRAVAASPRSATCHLHLGLVLEQSPDLEAALAAYREAARLEPRAADAHFNQGLVLLRLGRPAEAEECFQRVLALAPDDVEAALNLGRAMAGQGRWQAALDAFERALTRRPDWMEALNGKGGVLRRMGRHRDAFAVYRRALNIAPDNAGLHNNLGNVLRELGRYPEARQSFERAIELNERLSEAHLNLGRLRREAGDLAGARSACRRALALAPDLAGARPALASVLRGYLPSGFDPALTSELLRLMRASDVDPQDLALAAAAQVRARHRLPSRRVLEASDAPLPVAALARDELLRELLTHTLNVDPDLEAMLVALRRTLLFEAGPAQGEGPVTEAEIEGLSAALALQCFANQYLFESNEEEAARVEALAGAFTAPLSAGAPGPRERRDLLRLAMYRPLWQVEAVQSLSTDDLSGFTRDVARVIERTLVEPREEQRLAARIPPAGPVRNPVSQRVRAQYESDPYPRWLHIAALDRSPVADSLARRFAHWKPARGFGAGSRALVLGCGTGYEPIELALREPEFRVFAVDLSLASLAYAARMAEDLDIRTIRFLHGDLLDLRDIEGSFDLVSANGVLHHMRDPLAGWEAAASRLAEGGLMRVGLYSATARRIITEARKVIRRRKVPPTPEGMRAFRLALLRGELGPEFAELARSPDLHSLSSLRDLLFHVEEHHFDLEGVASALCRLGLEFVGFEHEDPGTALRYARTHPDDPRRLRSKLGRLRGGSPRDLQRHVPVLVREAGRSGGTARLAPSELTGERPQSGRTGHRQAEGCPASFRTSRVRSRALGVQPCHRTRSSPEWIRLSSPSSNSCTSACRPPRKRWRNTLRGPTTRAPRSKI